MFNTTSASANNSLSLNIINEKNSIDESIKIVDDFRTKIVSNMLGSGNTTIANISINWLAYSDWASFDNKIQFAIKFNINGKEYFIEYFVTDNKIKLKQIDLNVNKHRAFYIIMQENIIKELSKLFLSDVDNVKGSVEILLK